MLQELAARSATAAWAVGAMLFFLAVFVAVVAWVITRRREEMDARARMPLDDGMRESGFGNRDSAGGNRERGSGSASTPES